MGSFLYATRLHLLSKTHIMRMKNRVKHEKEIKTRYLANHLFSAHH